MTHGTSLGEVAASPIRNYNGYAESMRKGLAEKTWFVKHLPEDVAVLADFGCADGSLAREVTAKRWGIQHVVLCDHDPAMVALLKAQGIKEATEHFGMFQARIEGHQAEGLKSCLVLSSVIHEVLSQGISWPNFWAAISALKCDYIAIRDMAVSRDSEPHLVRDLEAKLKARYPEDAEREAKEDYFPVTVEFMLNTCTIGSGYKLRHFDHHVPPFLAEEWQWLYGQQVPLHTHIKMLLKRTS